MLNKVHHVTYVVENVDDMAAYIERNFSLTPIRSDEFTERGFKSILYQIGDTLVDFFQPLRDDTPTARQLQATGPGVMHVAWGVDGIDQVFADLQDKGNEMRGDGPSVSPFGYQTLNIDTGSSQGILFQLAEGDVSA
jgi:methylmalonyl-CoA epimerase